MSLRDWFARAVAAEQERVAAAMAAAVGKANSLRRPPKPSGRPIVVRLDNRKATFNRTGSPYYTVVEPWPEDCRPAPDA